MATDFKALGKYEQGALAAGVVAIIVSFISSYVRASYSGGRSLPTLNVSNGTNAWTSYGTFGMLLIVVAVAVVAVKAFASDNLPAGVPWSLVALATSALGTVLLILRAFTYSDGGLSSVSVGPGWSGYVLFVATIALTVFTALSFKESGEKMPEFNKKSTPPAA